MRRAHRPALGLAEALDQLPGSQSQQVALDVRRLWHGDLRLRLRRGTAGAGGERKAGCENEDAAHASVMAARRDGGKLAGLASAS
jgi:hypothetical protein